MKYPKFWKMALCLAALIALLVTSIASAAPKNDLVVTLNFTQNDFASDEDVLVTVTIHNPTRHTVKILKWLTPSDGIEDEIFTVTRDGQKVNYIGPIYKRPAITGKDYISIKSGESLVQTISLSEYYDLSISGQYDITYEVSSFSLYYENGNTFKFRDILRSETTSVKINAHKRPTPPPPPPSGGNAFNNCTTDQQTILESARNAAKVYASDSEDYLIGNKSGSRYTTWFGVLDSVRYDTVTNHFTAISNAMDTAGITFDCKCKQPYYAYVYPNQPYNIYLCKVFWSAPLIGTDSQAGTLIHEMSHFDIVSGTDDFVYGQSGAMELAITNPDNAINNADNHEYFAENTPPLP